MSHYSANFFLSCPRRNSHLLIHFPFSSSTIIRLWPWLREVPQDRQSIDRPPVANKSPPRLFAPRPRPRIPAHDTRRLTDPDSLPDPSLSPIVLPDNHSCPTIDDMASPGDMTRHFAYVKTYFRQPLPRPGVYPLHMPGIPPKPRAESTSRFPHVSQPTATARNPAHGTTGIFTFHAVPGMDPLIMQCCRTNTEMPYPFNTLAIYSDKPLTHGLTTQLTADVICSTSSSLSISSVTTEKKHLSSNVLIALSLYCNGWCKSNCRYWSVWVDFRKSNIRQW